MTINLLASQFKKLAADESWPRIPEEADSRGTTQFTWCVHNKDDTFHVFRTEQEAREYAESPLVRAKLALMVVEEEWAREECRDTYGLRTMENLQWQQETFIHLLNRRGITPPDYHNVKERVEQADKEEQ